MKSAKPKTVRLRVSMSGSAVNGTSVLPSSAYRFLRSCCADATHAITAKRGGRIVGFFRWFADGLDQVAAGTWVSREERRRGLATKMWRSALGKHISGPLEVVVTSAAGARFIDKLCMEFPERLHVERVPKKLGVR